MSSGESRTRGARSPGFYSQLSGQLTLCGNFCFANSASISTSEVGLMCLRGGGVKFNQRLFVRHCERAGQQALS